MSHEIKVGKFITTVCLSINWMYLYQLDNKIYQYNMSNFSAMYEVIYFREINVKKKKHKLFKMII